MINMIPKSIIEKLIDGDVHIFVKGINEKFSGNLIELTSDDLLMVKDKYNNISYIPLSEVSVITERQ